MRGYTALHSVLRSLQGTALKAAATAVFCVSAARNGKTNGYRSGRTARRTSDKAPRKVGPGATRKKTRNFNFAKLKPIAGIACVCVAVGAFALNFDFRSYMGRVETLTSRQITSVLIRAEFKYISKTKVQNVVRANLTQDFVNLDLDNLKNTLEMNPWVENVELTRVWPARLLINIQEQVPIARWGDHGFINRYGKKVNVETNSALKHLPRLMGPDNMEREIASEYLKISRLLAEKGIHLEGVSVNESTSWVLNLSQQRLFYLGAENLTDKLDLFLQIYEQHLAGSLDNVKKIDMRYQSGMAIEWIDSELQNTVGRKSRVRNYASN